MSTIRREVLQLDRADGGLDLYDPVFDRITTLTADERGALDAADVRARLEARLLLETPTSLAVLAAMVDSKRESRPRAAPRPEVPDFDWSRASSMPALLSAAWRDGERLRRLAEERAAGREVLVLRDFVAPAAVAALREAIAALPMQRMDTEVVHAERHPVSGEPAAWTRLMADATVRAVFGAVLGVGTLSDAVVLNAWRMGPGDFMAVHPDGKRYQATLSLGLSEGWRARDGGAIAFGTPTSGGFEVRERWLPHAGDACLFVPGPMSWHAVEPVHEGAGTRLSLTGWWSV